MARVRQHLTRSDKSYHHWDKLRWFLGGAEIYVEAIGKLRDALAKTELASRGMQALRDYLAHYTNSVAFTAMADEASRIAWSLAAVRYAILVNDSGVTVRRYDAEPDYSASRVIGAHP